MEGRADTVLFFLLHFSPQKKKKNLNKALSVAASGSFLKRVSTPMVAPKRSSSPAPLGVSRSPRPEERRTSLTPASPSIGSRLPKETRLPCEV